MQSNDVETIRERIVRTNEDGFNRKRVAHCDEIFSDGFIDHNAAPGTGAAGPESQKKFFRKVQQANARFVFLDVLVEGDMSGVQGLCIWPHAKRWGGLDPTGKAITQTGVGIQRWENNKMVERWGSWDFVAPAARLGAIQLRDGSPWGPPRRRWEPSSPSPPVAHAPLERTEADVTTNKEIVRQFLEELYNHKKMDVVDELVAENSVHMAGPWGMEVGVGRDHPRHLAELQHRVLPDLELSILHVFGERDKVAVNAVASGTHSDRFLGVPASGERLRFPVCLIFRLDDRRIVEQWGAWDLTVAAEKLGVLS